ncbi:hypothetical protein BH11PSE3_BH11PSE3_21030 [soil metagenome]
MQTRTLAAIGLSLLLAGCQGAASKNAAIEAQSANVVCTGYAIRSGTTTLDNCLSYQGARNAGPSIPPYRMDQYNNRVDAEGYAVDSTGRRMPVQSPYYIR